MDIAVCFATTKESNSVAASSGLRSGLRQNGMGLEGDRLRPG